MEVKQITNQEEWESFVLTQPYTLFVQSWHYGEFYRALDENFWVFGVYDQSKLIGGSLAVSTHAKRGNFLYLPYGPILPRERGQMALGLLIKKLKSLADQAGYDFIKASPFVDDSVENKNLFRTAGFRAAPLHSLAETTWLLDIKPAADSLLQEMKKNHRNLIRRCVKEGAYVTTSDNKEELKSFYALHQATEKRHGFHRFSDSYIEKEYSAFAPHGQAVIFQAYLPDGTLDSSAIIMYYGNMAAYRHGASLNINHRLPTSYLLQWEAIKEAKSRGMKWYNFWGISPSQALAHHPFRGLTHFKKGFGGMEKRLLPGQDLPLAWKYWLNWTVEMARRGRRGF